MVPDDGKIVGSVGCGTAATEQVLVAQGREVHGVDISPEAVTVAQGRLQSARLIEPGDRQPFAPASLDGLILADVIEHIPRAWDALKSFATAVRPGGWVVISVPNMRYVSVFARFVLGGDWPEHPVGIFDQTHVQVMTRRRLARWCDGAGLRVDQWFDRFDPNNPRRLRLFKTADALSLRLFHEWFMFQLQVRCRRPAATGGAHA